MRRAARARRGGRQRLDRAAQHYAAIIESSDDAILSKDLDGVILTWNAGAERLFGFTAEEAIGRPVTIIIPPDRLDEEPPILDKIRRGERIHHFETVRQRKDGSLVDISLTVSPIRDSDGRIVGASKIARDISELKRTRDRQHLLLREMSHRVKNLFALSEQHHRPQRPFGEKSRRSLRIRRASGWRRWRARTRSPFRMASRRRRRRRCSR